MMHIPTRYLDRFNRLGLQPATTGYVAKRGKRKLVLARQRDGWMIGEAALQELRVKAIEFARNLDDALRAVEQRETV